MVKQEPKEKSKEVKAKPEIFVEDRQNPAKEAEAKYLRALADYQNLLKQTAKEKLEFVKYANEGLLRELIPVYDHLKMSLQHIQEEENDWIVGVRHVVKQFQEVLTAAGVSEIAAIGQEFNPALMSALQQEATTEQEKNHQVAKIIRPGYLLRDKVIIPAQVIVYKYNLIKRYEKN